MFDFISGKIAELTPSYVVLEVGGLGFFINISLQTYSALTDKENAKLFIHRILREDADTLYGFFSRDEREIFRLLISVSGIGGNTARLMLSSLTADEIRKAILTNDVSLIKSVKGIGLKTAQRIIVDLKDKIDKGSETVLDGVSANNITEAVNALVVLGFNKKSAEIAVRKVYKANPGLSVENLVKESLKQLSK